MATKSGSSRIMDQDARRVLDSAARQRRARKALESLEKDNNHEDPHADLVMSKKALSLFQEDSPEKRPKRKTRTTEYYKQRFRKNLDQLLDEEAGYDDDYIGYLAAQVPSSSVPPRSLCAVCGFPSGYTCVTCGTKYCTIRCLDTHQETRCLKWTA
ncbi:zinc finger HIT domain-containing protein 1 [Eurytemora carolleeae]|uniref:zinc finger HIT domain-containing protein 1 n=1 Tax=Eurytemora carolleeae TaxID=1294199 RepID=UPI000C791895|nr:zinc finger HIT domain-containing protein 1 [Eurytemora carolleeae]XP_023324818.1 zinc finger HIT domain-containing protein 1 [Eurytemora carolleeae]XP_023324819.1 zinc finger HIT domain-containing protein 1 [Eurytemora carolleeae]|eukprot:XP_023324816.1 zinc finger HIT domain-containing protein 1-like [Eurytemora affinis]